MNTTRPRPQALAWPNAHRRVTFALCVVACWIVAALPAAGQVYAPDDGDLEVAPSQVDTTASVSFAGSGFQPGSTVALSLKSADGAATLDLGEVAASSDGTVDWESALPSEVEEGSYEVIASGVTADGATLVLTGDLVVGTPSGNETSGGGQSSAWWWAGGGLAVLAGGLFAARAIAARR